MTCETQLRGRFAPSPSGRMHLGNAFSALLTWLSVRQAGGEMLLRLEDLDPARCKPAYCAQVEEDLRWLGLDWDVGGSQGGEGYYQSRRSEIYRTYLEQLRAKGLLYPCFCSRNQLHAASAPHRSDGTPLYSGACRNLTPEQQAERAKTRKSAVRIRVPEEVVSFTDGVMGPQEQNLARECGDFILRRSDGVYAYQLAVVVDDALMGVNQVVRGEDLLDSTPRQIWLQRQLGFPQPDYYHVPLLYGRDGHRLSKRQRDLDLGAIRADGARPEDVVGRLACWAGLLDRPEPISAGELVRDFDWAKVRKTDIVVG
ncbi:MAG: tRNA glutamyl-Q(34) synthetase GluQRS [Clostridiales bacterium]|nr:tRNA glutamyl-Q(34) synthetase GluQRS [Clostridiales bacterium]